MSVTNETYRVQATLATAIQAIPVTFYFLEQDDLIVYQTVAGVDTLMALNTNYTLTGEGVEAGGTLTTIGGTVGAVWTIARADALTQSEEFIYSGSLAPSAVERGYDRLAMQIQRIYSMAARSIRLPVTNAEGGELALNDRKGTILGFDASTGAVEFTTKQSLLDDAAAAAEAAAQPLVDAAEAAKTAAELAETNAETAEANAVAAAGTAADDAAAAVVVSLTAAVQVLTDTATLQAGLSADSAADSELAKEAAQVAQVAAELAETNAETAEANAEQAVIDAAAQLALATTQANNAAGSASSASASAASADASATAALNAISQAYKGELAGASVPATSTTNGDTYRITSAGTSQGKTWVVGDAAIYNGSSGQWTQLTGFYIYADAADIASKAALIEREGLRFDGTAGAVIGGGGIPAVGTGDFTVWFMINPGAAFIPRFLFGASGAFGLQALNVSGGLEVVKVGIANIGSSSIVFSAGLPTIIHYVRSAGVGSFYRNGSFVDSITDTTNYTASSTFINSEIDGVSNASANTYAHFGHANYALTQSEITALIGRGLVTLPEQRGGSMVSLIPSGNGASLGATDANNLTNWSAYLATGSVGSGTRTGGAGSYYARLTRAGIDFNAWYNPAKIVSVNQKYLIRFWARASVSGNINFQMRSGGAGSSTSAAFALTTAWSQFSYTCVVTANTTIDRLSFDMAGIGINGDYFDIDDFEVIPLGTLFEQDSGQRNGGYMIRDTSGNGRHLELPETGVSINDPADTGFIEYTRTTDGYLLGDRRVIPSTGYLVEVVATGNGTVTLGESAGTPANVCASVTLTSTPQILPILVTQTSTGKLYVDLGTATTCTFKIRFRAV
jgi:hypothetical protein